MLRLPESGSLGPIPEMCVLIGDSEGEATKFQCEGAPCPSFTRGRCSAGLISTLTHNPYLHDVNDSCYTLGNKIREKQKPKQLSDHNFGTL